MYRLYEQEVCVTGFQCFCPFQISGSLQHHSLRYVQPYVWQHMPPSHRPSAHPYTVYPSTKRESDLGAGSLVNLLTVQNRGPSLDLSNLGPRLQDELWRSRGVPGRNDSAMTIAAQRSHGQVAAARGAGEGDALLEP